MKWADLSFLPWITFIFGRRYVASTNLDKQLSNKAKVSSHTFMILHI